MCENAKVMHKFIFRENVFNRAYMPLMANKSRYLVLYGGAGSGKSVFAGQKILFRMLTEPKHKILLVRKVGRTINNSQFRLIKDLIESYNMQYLFKISDHMLTMQCINGSMILSTGVDDVEKLKSIHGITAIWIEEATELTKKDFMQIDLRLRGSTKFYKQIILSFNPIDDGHWLKEMFFSENINAQCRILHTTFRDNKFIDKDYIAVLENLAAQDPDFYEIYTLGKWASPKNMIFGGWEYYDDTTLSAEGAGEPIYGIDFGYNSPSAVAECRIAFDEQHKPVKIFIRELLYKSKLTNADLTEQLLTSVPDKSSFIYADAAEPQRIEEIRRAGFNIHPADKSVNQGIDFMKRFKLMIHRDSGNLIKEIKNYKWKEDSEGNALDSPVKYMDHLLDAARYAIYTYSRKYLTGSSSFPEFKKRNATIDFDGY